MITSRLLKRQLKKAKISDFENIDSQSFQKLLLLIEQSYLDSENDRYILERSIDLSSQEMDVLNHSLENRVETEIKKREQQEQLLIHQSRQAAMGEMIGNIAHQWRQPLNTLGLVLQNLNFEYQMMPLWKNLSIKGTNLHKRCLLRLMTLETFLKKTNFQNSLISLKVSLMRLV